MKPPDANRSPTHYRPRLTLLMPSIVLLGLALRLYRLGTDSLWYDETVSAFLARQPVAELIAHTAGDIHPPAYYLLLHYWTRLSGSSEFALAFFSLVCGLLLIPLTYRLARNLTNAASARWAALLVALSPNQLWYSQEVRMYTLGAALGLAATLCALGALHNIMTTRKSLVFWSGYVILATLGLYTLYYFAFLLIVLNLMLLWLAVRHQLKRPAPAALVGANLLVLLAYLPWLPIAWRQAVTPPVPPWRSPTGLGPSLLETWSALTLGQSAPPAAVWPVLLLTLVLFGLGLLYLGRDSTGHLKHVRRLSLTVTGQATGTYSFLSGPLAAALLAAYTFGPLLLIQGASPVTPLYHVRYMFTYSPPFYIILAAGLVWLAQHFRQWIALAAAGVVLLAAGWSIYQYHVDPRLRPDDFRAAVRFIQTHWQPGDVLMTNAGYIYTAVDYYADLPGLTRRRLVPYPASTDPSRPLLLQTGAVNGDPQLGWGDPKSDFYAKSESDTRAALEQLSTDYARLWLLRGYDTVTDPNGLIRRWLAEQTVPLEDQSFAGESQIRVQGFLLGGAPQPPSAEPVEFEDGMVLAGWELPSQIWQSGQTIHLRLWWLASARPSLDYKMSLKLWSEDGELAAQGQDDWPVGSLYRATDWPPDRVVYQPVQLALPADLSLGQYWLNVELYRPDPVQPLGRLDGQDPVVTLGPVVVQ